MVQEELSIVIPIWNRYADLLDRTLYTLVNQLLPPHEIIISDTSSSESYTKSIKAVTSKYDLAQHIHNPLPAFSLSHSLNIGLKHTESEYILCTGAEMLFSQNYLKELSKIATDNVFMWSACGFLQKNTKYPGDIFGDWKKLLAQIISGSMSKMSPGTFHGAPRSWWFKIRGYDEQFPFAYMDSDIIRRATIDSAIQRGAVRANVAQVLHQWHEKSDLVGKLGGTYAQVKAQVGIIRNPDGWGEP